MKKKPAFVPSDAWNAAQDLLETYESERPLSRRWAKDFNRLMNAPELERTWRRLDQVLGPREWVYFLGLLTPIYDDLDLRLVLKKAATLRKDIASLAGKLSEKLRAYLDLTESKLLTPPDGLGSPEDVARDAFSNLPTPIWLRRVLHEREERRLYTSQPVEVAHLLENMAIAARDGSEGVTLREGEYALSGRSNRVTDCVWLLYYRLEERTRLHLLPTTFKISDTDLAAIFPVLLETEVSRQAIAKARRSRKRAT